MKIGGHADLFKNYYTVRDVQYAEIFNFLILTLGKFHDQMSFILYFKTDILFVEIIIDFKKLSLFGFSLYTQHDFCGKLISDK